MLDFGKAEAKELELSLLFDKLRGDLERELKTTEDLPGVKRLGNGYVTVSSKTFMEHNNLSPDYYITKEQVMAVLSVLNKTNTVSEFKSKLQELVTKKSVTVNGNTVRLNINMVRKLEEALGTKVVGKK